MRIYVINGVDEIGKTDFSVNLAEYLQANSKVLLLQGKRNSRSNIEDFFQKDGMITYDIADYFSGLVSLEKVIVHETNNLDFIISPLLEDKYNYNSQDMANLLSNINYDFVVMDDIAKNIIPEKTSIEIVSVDGLNQPFESDAFFINKVPASYDVRNDKDIIDNKGSRFLGTVTEGEYFKSVIENLVNQTPVEVQKLGFFERLKSSFRK